MDWTQALYIGLLALAIYTGKPPVVIAFAMIFDLVGTVYFAPDPFSVAIVDLLTVVILAGEGRRANVIAALFIAMQPIYLLHAFGLNNAAIYALIDCIAYLQLAVLGHWDVGLGRWLRNRRGRSGGFDPASPPRYFPPLNIDANQRMVSRKGVDSGA